MSAIAKWIRRLFGEEAHVSEDPEPTESVVTACRTVARRLASNDVMHAVIGGLGLGAHGVIRATEDVDFLIAADGEAAVHAAMTDLGFETISRTENLSTYLLQHVRVDFIHARRSYSQAMLRRAVVGSAYGVTVPIATAEDLIALKLQARKNDPARVQDGADIAQLVQYNFDKLDFDYLRRFFRLFDCESELDDLIETHRPRP